jgi:cytosine/adenosine deaminase-related metal-dependent hydrolase
LLLARVDGGPKALDARGAWRLATKGGAECLGRDDCGALEVGKCADVALYRVDDLHHAGMADMLAGLALAPPGRAEFVVVDGKVIVRDGRLQTADEDEVAREIAATSARLAG